ncbi:MAG: hypothetical protein ACI906_003085, partial [Candidatus Latescibacterota bacterium]
ADSFGGFLKGSERLACELTLKDGTVAWDWNGRAANDYRQMGSNYGIREGEYLVMPSDV